MKYQREIIYILVAGGIGLASLNTGNNVQWLIFALMCGFACIAKIRAYSNIRKITVKISSANEYFAGAHSFLPIKFINTSKLLSSHNSVADISIERLSSVQKVFIQNINKNDHTVILADCVFPERGEYRVNSIKLTSLFPFGFFKSSKKLNGETSIIVYPKIISINASAYSKLELEFKSSWAKKGDGNELLRLYLYSGYEPNRNIHWKLSAKKDELWAKEFSTEESEKVTIYLDWEKIPPDQRERAISIAAGLCLRCNTRNTNWRLMSGAFETAYSSGLVHLKYCLKYLALLNDYKPVSAKSSDDEQAITISELLGAPVNVPLEEHSEKKLTIHASR